MNRAASNRDKNGVTGQESTSGQGVHMGSSDVSDAELVSLVASQHARVVLAVIDTHGSGA